MNARDRTNIERIADELRYIKSVTVKTTREDFLRDETLQHALSMAAQRNLQIGKAVLRLRELSADERARDLFERREKERRDIAALNRGAKRQQQIETAKVAL